MKKLLIFCLLISGSSIYNNTEAQLNVSINVGSQPTWGPRGYKHVDYYYLPDMDTYYYVPKKQFIYLNGNNWVFVPNPPARYRNVNLYRTRKIVINEPRPWLQHSVYRVKYKKYKGNYGNQKTIKYKSGHNYGHYKNNSGKGNSKHGNNGKGNGHGNGGHGH